ncbi:hypothetical protein K2Z83_21120 [Oscillochloris sp. ZM17-4]|uniref:hypothetical protein n=1 Tax=Oscillochloris sp. ZM17-4 TaxID=2866714 RepID=UPI001C736876|nr:hypothetical protein [Oscillochloris sp. ZM17-4]MBX0330174.1 hypothetical protein [Oscillochloris sp. ZM17-4]
MDPRKNQAAMIIHAASVGAAAISGFMATVAAFGLDIPLLAGVNVAMIVSLGHWSQVKVSAYVSNVDVPAYRYIAIVI